MLHIYRIGQAEEWDSIVRSFQKYDVYWLSGYVKAFMIHGDGEPLLFYYEDGGIRGINVVMKRDIAEDKHFTGKLEKGKYFDFSTPYGYGGWLIEGNDDSEELFSEYGKWCEDNRVISEFVRCHPVLKNHMRLDPFYEVVRMGSTVKIDLVSEQQIWDDFTSKNRGHIRKAVKSGVYVQQGFDEKIMNEFRMLYEKTMDHDHADPYYYFKEAFYDELLKIPNDEISIFYAEYENKIIAATIILMENGQLHYHLSAQDFEYRNLAATNLMLWEAAKWGAAHGFRTFHLGGGLGGKEDSLFKFKESFNKLGNCGFYIGKKVFHNDIYTKLIELRKKDDPMIEKISFFPVYRGGYCDRSSIEVFYIPICRNTQNTSVEAA